MEILNMEYENKKRMSKSKKSIVLKNHIFNYSKPYSTFKGIRNSRVLEE